MAPKWIEFFEKELAAYKTPNVMMIWGDDFAHQYSSTFNVLDMMLTAIEAELEKTGKKEVFEIKLSTVGRYFESVFNDAKKKQIEWSIKTDDFWAYNMMSKPNHFWTGYFSTN